MNQQDISLLAQSAALNSTNPEVTEYRRLVDQYSVNCFAVHHGGQGKSEHNLISPLFATLEQADEFKVRSEDKYPDCFVGHYVSYFTSEHNERRQELLTKIVDADAQNPLDSVVTCFAVVRGTGSRQHIPIGSYFRTKIEAEHFQSVIASKYPDCRIAQHFFRPDDDQSKQELLEKLLGEVV